MASPEIDCALTFPSTAFPPPPKDLTASIVKIEHQYSEAGHFGDVYKCLYNDVMVAVKAFRFELSSGMAHRELGIWRRLDHPNVVPFLGIATGFGVSGSKSLVSLWMCNGSLESFLRRYEDLEVDHRLRLLLDIANGLCYLHSFTLPITSSSNSTHPIFHGDLNPANVLLDDNYTARLVDFGYASMVGEMPEALSYLKRSTHRPGALRWSAPEQVELNSAIVRRTTESDIYSFGCIALQVLSGKQPWWEIGEDIAVLFQLSLGETPGRPESRPIDDRHWELIERCLSRTLDQRPAAEAIVFFLEQFLEHFPHSQPLRDVIKSLQDTQQSDSSNSSSSTLIVNSGDSESDGVARPGYVDQHVASGRSCLHRSIGNGVDFDESLTTLPGSTTQDEGCAKKLRTPWLFRTPHE